MKVMVMMTLHILICEPIQIDIVELLEPDEDVWVTNEDIKAQDNWQVESSYKAICQDLRVALRFIKLKNVYCSNDCQKYLANEYLFFVRSSPIKSFKSYVMDQVSYDL